MSSWCAAPELVKKRTKLHDTFLNGQLLRKVSSKPDKVEIIANWKHCYQSCSRWRMFSTWTLKTRSCLELLHRAPFAIGGETFTNNTAQIMSPTSKFRGLVCPNATVGAKTPTKSPLDINKPGSGIVTCYDSTEMWQLLISLFEQSFLPVPDMPTSLQMFPPNRNPSPIMQQILSLYSMHATGEVTVWTTDTDFSQLTGPDSPLKPLLIYNQNITKVRVVVETPQVSPLFILPKLSFG